MDVKELKQLAIDISENKVFGTWQMNQSNLSNLYVIFMPITFMTNEPIDNRFDILDL